jgi:hypothetical protein
MSMADGKLKVVVDDCRISLSREREREREKFTKVFKVMMPAVLCGTPERSLRVKDNIESRTGGQTFF